jgi:hypothetical protein
VPVGADVEPEVLEDEGGDVDVGTPPEVGEVVGVGVPVGVVPAPDKTLVRSFWV